MHHETKETIDDHDTTARRDDPALTMEQQAIAFLNDEIGYRDTLIRDLDNQVSSLLDEIKHMRAVMQEVEKRALLMTSCIRHNIKITGLDLEVLTDLIKRGKFS